MNKIILSLICSKASPKPDAEADSQFLAAVAIAAPLAAVPGTHTVALLMRSLLQMKTRCRRIEKKTEVDVLVTQKCVPTTENVCTKETVETEEIEYEKVCQDVVSKICDAPAAVGYIGRREAEAETDPQYVRYAAHAVAPVATTAVAHSDQCHCQVALPQTSSR